MNKMMEKNCNAYKAKGILGYRKEKKHMEQLHKRTREKKQDRDKERMRTQIEKQFYFWQLQEI